MNTEEIKNKQLQKEHYYLHQRLKHARRICMDARLVINNVYCAIPLEILEGISPTLRFLPHVNITNQDYQKFKALEEFFKNLSSVLEL